jgi:hypothetical protein
MSKISFETDYKKLESPINLTDIVAAVFIADNQYVGLVEYNNRGLWFPFKSIRKDEDPKLVFQSLAEVI